MKKIGMMLTVICAVFAVSFSFRQEAAAKGKTYTITPSSKPCDNSKKYHTYNKYTKNYYTLMSYMHKFEKSGGGTLVLKKGTYTITNTVYVPSNVTIRMKDGVKLVKGSKTGVSDMPPSSTMFQLIRPSKRGKSKVYGSYQGEKNISLLGEGKVILDMKKYKKGSTPSIAVILGHNQNVKMKGISFQNLKLGHFIEMDASKKVRIEKCSFTNLLNSGKYNKEAINLDTPDPVTGGFSQKWSKQDKTPNQDVTIKNCSFTKLERAIGTHRYSKEQYHKNIKITGNKMKNVQTPLAMLNWREAEVRGNVFEDCKSNTRYDYIIFAAGTQGITFTDNDFYRCQGKDLFKIYDSYQTAQKEYPPTRSLWKAEEIKLLSTNRAYACEPSGLHLDGEWISLEVQK